MSPFDGFTCKPYYRLIPIDGTFETPYALKKGFYVVRKEYDARFFCTWTLSNAIATRFSILFGDSLTVYQKSNMSQLRKINMGYVVPLPNTAFETLLDVKLIHFKINPKS